MVPNPLHCFESIHPRHLDIHNNERWRGGGCLFECFGTIIRRRYLMAAAFKIFANQLNRDFVIIYQQHKRRPGWGSWLGRRGESLVLLWGV